MRRYHDDHDRRLQVLKRVTQEDMPALYTTAAVLLIPSHYEGFGLTVLEAQMCGTPVVCSDAGSLLEVATGGTSALPTNECEALAAAVAQALAQAMKPEPRAELPDRFERQTWLWAIARLHAETLHRGRQDPLSPARNA